MMDIQQEIQDALKHAGINMANEMLREWRANIGRLRASLFDQPVSYAAYTEEGKPPIDPDKTVEGSIAHPVTDSTRLLDSRPGRS
jgi:hypothetical protein